MTLVYLVRHGENPANLTRQFSHRLVDYSLTPKGVVQAEQTAAYFKTQPVGAVFASPLKRAVETAAIIAQPLGLEVQVLEQFREINVGSLESQPTAENWAFHDQVFAEWRAGRHEVTFPEGENYLILLARMRDGLREVLRRNPDHPSVVIAHAGIVAATIRDVCQGVAEQLLQGSNPNCAVTEIEVEFQKERLVGQLRRWADCQHLS